ncbi:MAG TPA: cytochrome c biogenesis protein CcdA, partial [Glycomyces sp.]|nr:cytochrome c biogenesis protein CcdA [Glycomyces sp.]
MGDWFEQTAASGSLMLAIPVALVAGLVSFFSPCVIPLLPGYLSYATGLSGADLAAGEAARHRWRMLVGSLLFVAGFAVVFVLVGAAFGSVGAQLR